MLSFLIINDHLGNIDKMKSGLKPVLFLCVAAAATPLVVLTARAAAGAVETAVDTSANSLLGADVKGNNWTVDPTVHSDGFLRLFDVKTPYGDFQVNGRRRMSERLQELRALQTLDKMSRTKAFGDALGKAGMAPIRFGRDLIVDPVETTGNLISGVGRMFQSVASTVSGKSSGRNSLFDRVSGITAAERELAVQLKVDPYTDFTPLRNGLNDVAKAAAAGGLSVTAAISAIPGGAGIAMSASSTAGDLASSIGGKRSDEIVALVTQKLDKLGVGKAVAAKFVANKFYSPNDDYAIADALEKLNAANSASFVSVAADADSYDVAKFQRYRAELLLRENARLGTLKEFVIVTKMAINHNAAGDVVAAFPFDTVAWTDSVSLSLARLSDDIAKRGEKGGFFFPPPPPFCRRPPKLN